MRETNPKDKKKKLSWILGWDHFFSLPWFSISYVNLLHFSVKVTSVRKKNQEISVMNTISGLNKFKNLV